MSALVHNLVEALTKPGVMSLVGIRRERACAKDLKAYFVLLGERLEQADVASLADAGSVEMAINLADVRLRNVLRQLRPLLVATLSVHLQQALVEGDKIASFEEFAESLTEASGHRGPIDPNAGLAPSTLAGAAAAATAALGTGAAPTRAEIQRGLQPVLSKIDRLGLSGEEAAAYAAQHAAELVTGIDETTRRLLAEAIARGIRERLGVDGLGRLIRREVQDMSVYRGKLIASTEMNDAFSEAAMRKMTRLGIDYKRLIAAPDACKICLGVAARGPIPRDEEMVRGKLRTPLHPWCRCATVASRPPGYKGQTATAVRAARAKKVTLGR